MNFGRASFVAAIACLPLFAHAAPPVPAANPDAQKLIALLGDEKFVNRAQATEGLEKLGPSVLPQLHDALNKPADSEARRRLEEVIIKLETMGALKPTRVTLKTTDLPIRKVVEELATKSGYKLELWPPAGNDEREKRLLSIDLADVTFWDALQQVCEQGGLIFQEGWYGNDNMTIRLQMGDAFPGFLCHEGPFRIVARNMNYYRNLELGGGVRGAQAPEVRRSESLNLNLSLNVEPRLPLYGVGQPAITEAIDDLGQSLKVPSNQNQNGVQRSYYSGYRGFMQHVNLTLNPMANGRRIKSLKGTIPVTLIALQRPKITVDLTEFAKPEPKPAKADAKPEAKEKEKEAPKAKANEKANLQAKLLGQLLQPAALRVAPPGLAAKENPAEAKSKTFKSGSTTLIVEDVSRNGNQVTLKLTVQEAAGKNAQQDYSWVNTVIQRIEVLDDKGVKLQSNNSSWGMNGQSVQGTFTYGGNGVGGAPAKLVYHDWITLSHDVPFSFQDLPLP